MKPIDFRNTNFEALREQLDGLRAAALRAWREHGPGTTREVAMRAGMDLLTFRPRTTELMEMGLVSIVMEEDGKPQRRQREGVYAATTLEAFEIWRRLQIENQLQLI